MKRQFAIYESVGAAGNADREYYASLTGEERLEIQFELIARHRGSLGEAAERLERVHRVVELEGG